MATQAAVGKGVGLRRDGGGSHSHVVATSAVTHSHGIITEDSYAPLPEDSYVPVAAAAYTPELSAGGYFAPPAADPYGATGYGATTAYEESGADSPFHVVAGGLDLATTLMAPILIMFGLSMIFTRYTPLTTVRRRRRKRAGAAGKSYMLKTHTK